MTMRPAQGTPPGWYPDPTVAGRSRWWDGRRWTAMHQPSATAAPEPGAIAVPPLPRGWYPDVGAPGGRRWWDGERWLDEAP